MNLDSATLVAISKYATKPSLFEPGELHFWDDPYISESMLEAHLNPDFEGASRKAETIKAEVGHLFSSGMLKPGNRVLDMGCGPGLYASKFAEKGMKVTGIDISERSLDYARRYAEEKGLDIEYRHLDFLNIDYSGEFDAVVQIYGELSAFSDKERDAFLEKIYRALKPDGMLIFDVSTRAQRMKEGLRNRWYTSENGFWRPENYLVLEHGFDYPEQDVWLDQYIIVGEDGSVTVYRDWFHDYTRESINQVLGKAGYQVLEIWNDFTGNPYEEGGDWIAIASRKMGR
ncbi:class I SAM-dependent methyltransferase [Chloroflexota bacterium]